MDRREGQSSFGRCREPVIGTNVQGKRGEVRSQPLLVLTLILRTYVSYIRVQFISVPNSYFFPVPNLTNNIIRIRGLPPTYKVPVKLVTEPLVASSTQSLSSTLPATNFNPTLQTVSSVHIAVKVSRRTLEVFP